MKHWVFDLDGTLVDSFHHYFVSLEEIFEGHGARFAPELRHAALTQPLVEFFEEKLGRDAVAPALQLLREKSNRDAESIRAFQALEETIRQLVARGSKVAVWTNRDLESASLILKHSGLEKYSELCVSGTCVVRRKPETEGLVRIIDHFGCAPGEVTMVGDHEHDVTAAKQVGARAVRASWHGYWREDDCTHADFQFRDAEEFRRWALG